MTNAQAVIPAPSSQWRYLGILLIGTIAGGWAAIFARMAQLEGVPTTVIIAFRMTGGALLLAPLVLTYYAAELRAVSWRGLILSAGAGLWMSLHLIFGFGALEYVSVLVSSVLVGSSPLWIALFEVSFLKARLHQLVWIGLAVTISGGVIITLSGNSDTAVGHNPALGITLSIISAIVGSLYAIMGRKSRTTISFVPYLWLIFLFGSIVSLAAMLLDGASLAGHPPNAYVVLILLTVFVQIGGHATYNYVLRFLSATYCSVVGQLGVIISGVLAFIIFHEIPGALQLPGSIVIIIGVLLVNLGQGKST